MTTLVVLSAKVSYAVRLYLELLEKGLKPPQAYASAVALAGLTTAAEKRDMRTAVLAAQR